MPIPANWGLDTLPEYTFLPEPKMKAVLQNVRWLKDPYFVEKEITTKIIEITCRHFAGKELVKREVLHNVVLWMADVEELLKNKSVLKLTRVLQMHFDHSFLELLQHGYDAIPPTMEVLSKEALSESFWKIPFFCSKEMKFSGTSPEIEQEFCRQFAGRKIPEELLEATIKEMLEVVGKVYQKKFGIKDFELKALLEHLEKKEVLKPLIVRMQESEEVGEEKQRARL